MIGVAPSLQNLARKRTRLLDDVVGGRTEKHARPVNVPEHKSTR
jgi:hypothetical protein